MGSSTPLANLTVSNANRINVNADITVSGSVLTLRNPVSLSAGTGTITITDNIGIDIESTIDGNRDLILSCQAMANYHISVNANIGSLRL